MQMLARSQTTTLYPLWGASRPQRRAFVLKRGMSLWVKSVVLVAASHFRLLRGPAHG